MMTAAFDPVRTCWICGGTTLAPVHELIFELSAYGTQDPELAAYTGSRLTLCRCARCGFAQPAALPALPRYFDRMYDQRWSDDWIRSELEADVQGRDLRGDPGLAGPASRPRAAPAARRRRARRPLRVAGSRAGWTAEGLELNPKTAAYAARRTGASIRQLNVHDAARRRRAYDAITLTDVLEHIPDPRSRADARGRAPRARRLVAVKVPSGPSQLLKETWRGRLLRGYRPTVADNLVHVNHFSPASLRGRSSARASSTSPSGPARRSCPRRQGCGARCRARRGAPSTTRRGCCRAACIRRSRSTSRHTDGAPLPRGYSRQTA